LSFHLHLPLKISVSIQDTARTAGGKKMHLMGDLNEDGRLDILTGGLMGLWQWSGKQ
jgi:hypothetical protein